MVTRSDSAAAHAGKASRDFFSTASTSPPTVSVSTLPSRLAVAFASASSAKARTGSMTAFVSASRRLSLASFPRIARPKSKISFAAGSTFSAVSASKKVSFAVAASVLPKSIVNSARSAWAIFSNGLNAAGTSPASSVAFRSGAKSTPTTRVCFGATASASVKGPSCAGAPAFRSARNFGSWFASRSKPRKPVNAIVRSSIATKTSESPFR